MLKSEAKLATHIRRILGKRTRVVLGYPQINPDEKRYPEVYLRFNQFCDLTSQQTGSGYSGRQHFSKGKQSGYKEQRPAYIAVHIDVISDDYLETQEIRQKLLGAIWVYLDSLRVLQLSDPKDGNIDMAFSDISPSIRDFSINPINHCSEPLFCGHIQYELNGFLHVCVKG